MRTLVLALIVLAGVVVPTIANALIWRCYTVRDGYGNAVTSCRWECDAWEQANGLCN